MKTYWFVRSFLSGDIYPRQGKLVYWHDRTYVEVGIDGTTDRFVLGQYVFESEQDAVNAVLASLDQKINSLFELVQIFELQKSAIFAKLTGDFLGN